MIQEQAEWGGNPPYGLAIIGCTDCPDQYLVIFADGHQFQNFHDVDDAIQAIFEEANKIDQSAEVKDRLLVWAEDLKKYAEKYDLTEKNHEEALRF